MLVSDVQPSGSVTIFFFFLQLQLWHKDVPGLGVKLELQLPAYTTATAPLDPSHICDLHCSWQQCLILNRLSEARDQTHTLRTLLGSQPTEPQQELQSGSAIQILFHHGLLQDIEYSSLYYTGGLCCLPILYIVGCFC